MNTITDDILKLANDDMISHGLVTQFLKQIDTSANPSEKRVKDALKEILATGKIEMGTTKMTTSDYVEFVAWNGTIEERINRAIEAVATVNGPDKEFAYWLCLRENVDCFEN
jgi:hypothetical protein